LLTGGAGGEQQRGSAAGGGLKQAATAEQANQGQSEAIIEAIRRTDGRSGGAGGLTVRADGGRSKGAA
jgi:hypothetical protein